MATVLTVLLTNNTDPPFKCCERLRHLELATTYTQALNPAAIRVSGLGVEGLGFMV